jgi:hypothetical protein
MDNLETKNVQRNSGSKKESIDEEVQKLLKKTSIKITDYDFNKLRDKYGNEELVEKIQNAYLEKFSEITKRAKKFAQLIREKYSNSQYPFHILLEKAIKYKEKHGLTDEEFSEFQRIYENELVGLKSNEIMQPSTNIGKMLGNITLNTGSNNGRRSDSDYKFEQEIYKLHAATKQLHAQVVLQSMMYEDCKIEAITGRFNKDINIVGLNSSIDLHTVYSKWLNETLATYPIYAVSFWDLDLWIRASRIYEFEYVDDFSAILEPNISGLYVVLFKTSSLLYKL